MAGGIPDVRGFVFRCLDVVILLWEMIHRKSHPTVCLSAGRGAGLLLQELVTRLV